MYKQSTAKIMHVGRRPDEDYVTWVRRATKKAEEAAKKSGVKCWLSMHLTNKWRWAESLANMDSDRWAARTTFWRDSDWWSYQPRGSSSYGARPIRARPGNMLRWEDDLRKYTDYYELDFWQKVALNAADWNSHEKAFVAYSWR
jgi:hypothetical protein